MTKVLITISIDLEILEFLNSLPDINKSALINNLLKRYMYEFQLTGKTETTDQTKESEKRN